MNTKNKLLALIVALIWGFNFVVIRWGIEDMHPMTMTVLRFLLTAIPAIFLVKRPDIPIKLVALYGVMFGSGVWGIMNFAVYLGMPAGIGSLLIQLSTFLTIVIAVVAFKESMTKQKTVGVLMAFLGFGLICVFKSNNISYLSLALAILSAIFLTLCNVFIKVVKPKDVISFTVWSSLFVPLPFMLMSLAYFAYHGLPISPLFAIPSVKGWIAVLFQAFVTTLFGYASWAYLINKNGLSNVVAFGLIVPIAGLFFGWVIYDEVLTLTELVGSAMVLLGLANVVLVKKQIHSSL